MNKIFFFLSLFVSALSYSQTQPKKESSSPFKWSLYSELNYTVQAEKQADGTRPESKGIYLVPKLKISDYTIKADISYSYDVKNTTSTDDWDDARLTFLGKGYNFLSETFKITPSIYFDIPLSKESRDNRGTILITNPGFVLALNSAQLGWDDLLLTYSAHYGFYSNQYTTKLNGDVANKYRLTQVLTGGYKFSKFKFTELFYFYSNYSYDNVTRNTFKHIDSLTYSITDQFEIGFSHCNGPAPLFNTSTYENNLNFYSQETSSYRILLGFTI